MSARAYDGLRKLSRTIADLQGVDEIGPEHVSEAVTYRSLDRLGGEETMRFEWNDAKNHANVQKHGIDFSLAAEVFADPFLLIEYDEEHSEGEDRYIALGRTTRGVILFVVHTDRFQVIRIISARLAARSEVMKYEQEIR